MDDKYTVRYVTMDADGGLVELSERSVGKADYLAAIDTALKRDLSFNATDMGYIAGFDAHRYMVSIYLW